VINSDDIKAEETSQFTNNHLISADDNSNFDRQSEITNDNIEIN